MTPDIDWHGRVTRGAEALDEHWPGWELKIDTETLDLGHDMLCILGQVFSGFAQGLYIMGMSHAVAAERGFLIDDDEWYPRRALLPDVYDPGVNRKIYAPLTEAWRQLIAERMALGGA